jgi:hypothetical protein
LHRHGPKGKKDEEMHTPNARQKQAPKSERPSKAEIKQINLRKRLKELRRLFQGRYGHTLPDDDAGQHDAWVQANHLAWGSDPHRRIYHFLDLWAPWMTPDSVENLVTSVLDNEYNPPQTWGSEEIAAELNVTIHERDKYRLSTFGSVDMSPEERRRRDNKLRNRRARRKAKIPTRAQWLAAHNISRDKPWIACGMGRTQWYLLPKKARRTGQVPGQVRDAASLLCRHTPVRWIENMTTMRKPAQTASNCGLLSQAEREGTGRQGIARAHARNRLRSQAARASKHTRRRAS